MSISWETPKPNGGAIAYYNVTVENLSDGGLVYSTNVTTTCMHLDNLKTSTWYKYTVSACARENDCGSAAVITAWTLLKSKPT